MKVTIASLKETEEYLRNKPYWIVTPLRSRKYKERLRKRQEEASQKGTKKKESS